MMSVSLDMFLLGTMLLPTSHLAILFLAAPPFLKCVYGTFREVQNHLLQCLFVLLPAPQCRLQMPRLGFSTRPV